MRFWPVVWPLSLHIPCLVYCKRSYSASTTSTFDTYGHLHSNGSFTSSEVTLTATSSAFEATGTSEDFDFPIPDPWPRFKTEPNLKPVIFDIQTFSNDRSLLSPGYIFIDPTYARERGGEGPWGPQIYDNGGNLIYHGHQDLRTQGFRVCDFLGESGNHLCIHERLGRKQWRPSSQIDRKPSGRKYVLDDSYELASHNFSKGLLGFGTNGHEFNMLPGGYSFLHPIEVVKGPVDLTPFNGPREGYYVDGCFQEIETNSIHRWFEWCVSDHINIWETDLFLELGEQKNTSSPKAGTGSERKGWDFAHINSVDKNEESDYLVSFRHMDQIMKVAGVNNTVGAEPGTLLWRLGGDWGNVEMDNFTFSKQHDIRYVSTIGNETIVSLFDNAWEGTNEPSSESASGQIVSVNNVTMKATLLSHFPHLESRVSAAKGSMQILPNKNVLVGWGRIPSFSEFLPDGTLLRHAKYTADMMSRVSNSLYDLEHSYRVYKFPWTGRPKWPPKLQAYSRTCSLSEADSPLMAWVSWNGATEVREWRFSIATEQDGPWLTAGTFKRKGYETEVVISNALTSNLMPFAPFVSVEALASNSTVLATVTAKTFVPKQVLRSHCDGKGCFTNATKAFDFSIHTDLDKGRLCETPSTMMFFVTGILLLCVEFITGRLESLVCGLVLSAYVPGLALAKGMVREVDRELGLAIAAGMGAENSGGRGREGYQDDETSETAAPNRRRRASDAVAPSSSGRGSSNELSSPFIETELVNLNEHGKERGVKDSKT